MFEIVDGYTNKVIRCNLEYFSIYMKFELYV
jgi:hypothetical protein